MKKKLLSEFLVTGCFALVAFAICTSPALAQTTTWIDSTGDWFNVANWSSGVPTSSIDAYVNNGGTAQINSAGAAARSLTLGQNGGDSGTVSVNGEYGTLLLPSNDCTKDNPTVGSIYVGYRGAGKLTISNGGAVTTGSAYIAALTTETLVSNGAVTVTGRNGIGTGSNWGIRTLYAGCPARLFVGATESGSGGTGLLSVTNGGTVTVNNGSNLPAVTRGLSGTLTGNGTITTISDSTSGRTMDVSGTLAPTVTLAIFGTLLLENTATTTFSVTPQDVGNDFCDVSETATLNGRVSVTMTGAFTPGTQFVLLHATDGRNGTFSSQSIQFPTGEGFTPRINYDGYHVYLYLEANQ
jgi:hypothetical protein